MSTHRELCLRCRRPTSVCYCDHLPSVPTRTRVVFLQHPRERYVAIGTCRMAHLSLPSSEMYLGVSFEGHARVEALCADRSGKTAILFPGPGALDPTNLPDGPPETLIVVDGTWVQARKVIDRNPGLKSLPRIGLVPAKPGNYRIRKEPADHCVSTIEAVVEVLGHLEKDPERFAPMIRAFDHMVDTQIARHASREGPPRKKRPRHRQPRPAMPPALVERKEDLVVVYAEANSHAASSPVQGPAELMQLVAVRATSGERFEAVIAPRRPLAPNAPHHLELSADELLAGEVPAAALERWQAFLHPSDVLCGWGHFAVDLLEAEGMPKRESFDLRLAVAQKIRRRAGGIEEAAKALCPPTEDSLWSRGRSGQRIRALEQLLGYLLSSTATDERHAGEIS